MDIVDHHAYEQISDCFAKAVATRPKGSYEEWLRFHKMVLKTLKPWGTFGTSVESDFYCSGDWFHSLEDHVCICSEAAIRVLHLSTLQSVVRQQGADAFLTINGEFMTPMHGLQILIHAEVVVLAWRDLPRDACRALLVGFGMKDLGA